MNAIKIKNNIGTLIYYALVMAHFVWIVTTSYYK